MFLPSINFLHLTISEIQPGQTISRWPPTQTPAHPPAHPDTMGENNTPTAHSCGVKNVDNFQRNARGSHLVFQNEATFSPREAYPPMKISCKFGEPSWCSFPLRALTLKISLRVAAAAVAA